MIPDSWRQGEVAVIGLGRSGIAAARFLAGNGLRVYASDAAATPPIREAARALGSQSIAVDTGSHDLARIEDASVVVTSPGVPPNAEPLAAARASGREILAELDLAALAFPSTPMIVVTGTNGKTTTTVLIAHLLQTGGLRAESAGNIGRPLIEVVSTSPALEWVVVEASSFQLHDAPHLRPAVGVLTNLAPDHLDRYASAEEYYRDKQNLFLNATDTSTWILNADEPEVLRLAGDAEGSKQLFSLKESQDAWFDRADGTLRLGEDVLFERAELDLLGDHNVANALAAALAARAAGITNSSIAHGLRGVPPLPHRLESVREVDGVLWINDSKATNVSSTAVALDAMMRPYVLLAGGRSKGNGYEQLVPGLANRCRLIVVFGESRNRLKSDLGEAVSVQTADSLDAAIAQAKQIARPGDAVLLSPACASFDQFENYERRGERFRALVEAM